jgi:hypothetical protein
MMKGYLGFRFRAQGRSGVLSERDNIQQPQLGGSLYEFLSLKMLDEFVRYFFSLRQRTHEDRSFHSVSSHMLGRKRAGKGKEGTSTCARLFFFLILLLLCWVVFVFSQIFDSLQSSQPAEVFRSFEVEVENEVNSVVDTSQSVVALMSETYLENSGKKLVDTHFVPSETIAQIQPSDPKPSTVSQISQNKVLEVAHQGNDASCNTSKIHVVFSTDCTPFQDWQTLVFFYSARAVRQDGPVTRIASGCDSTKQLQLTNLYKKLYPEYSVHFTPDFKKDERTGDTYHFYNKPRGVLHWIENSQPKICKGTIVAICDPDFIFLRPLSTRMSGQPNTLMSPGIARSSEMIDYVTQGHPVAQQYGLGAPWVNDFHQKFNRTYICGPGSPCLSVASQQEGGKYYSVGPPYIVEVPK